MQVFAELYALLARLVQRYLEHPHPCRESNQLLSAFPGLRDEAHVLYEFSTGDDFLGHTFELLQLGHQVDFGVQTSGGIDKNTLEISVCDVLLGEVTAAQALQHSEDGGYDILPANADLTAAEVQLMNKIGRERQLALASEPLGHNYDYILIDCPPSLNMLTVNALVAANGVVIPMQCEYYALEGLSSLLDTIEQIRVSVNPEIRIEGLLRTMYDPRNNLSNDVSSELVEHFGDRVYRTVIPRNVALAEAPSYGQSILKYNKNSRGSMAYLALAGEVLRRDAKQHHYVTQ